jgi:hypothetical protein
MEQKKLTNLTLTAAIIAVLGVFLGSYIWVPYFRIICCAIVAIITIINLIQWKNLRKIDLVLNIVWLLWAGWSIFYLVSNRL